MNIAVDSRVAAEGKAALTKGLEDLGADLAAVMHAASRLQSNTITFVAETLKKDVAQIGDALAWFGAVQEGLGKAMRGMQGLHAAAHEAANRLLPSDPAPQAGGGGDKTPPPKP